MPRLELGSGWLLLAGVLGALGIGIGAFAAHGLPAILAAKGLDAAEVARRVAHTETAARYQMYHALALLIVGLATGFAPTRWWHLAGFAFALGVILFSGSLYAIVITGRGAWGRITPLGGICFLVGWVAISIASMVRRT